MKGPFSVALTILFLRLTAAAVALFRYILRLTCIPGRQVHAFFQDSRSLQNLERETYLIFPAVLFVMVCNLKILGPL